jgi:transposase
MVVVFMKFVGKLIEAERLTLTDCMQYHDNNKCRIRAHVVLLSARGYKINEIADIYQLDRDTISVWLDSWEKEGIVFIYDIPKTGRPNKLTEEERKRVIEAVAEDPRSIKRTIGIVKDEFDKEVSADTIKRILKGCNQVWKRIRTSLKSKRD